MTNSRCSIRLYCTQVKLEDASTLIEIFKVRMSRHLDTSAGTQVAKIMVQYGSPVVPLQRNLYGHLVAGPLWKRQFEKVLLENGWGRF